MELLNFDAVTAKAQELQNKSVVAVAGAADLHVLEAILEAKRENIAEAVLVGDENHIRQLLRQIGQNPSDFQIEHPAAGMDEAETAVEVIKRGNANFLMKGNIESSVFLRPVVKKENDLRTGRVMSHLGFFHFAGYHKLICCTDGGMNTCPDLEHKKDILQNAFSIFHQLGYEMPKAAVLCCKETLDEKIEATVDARRLQEMAEQKEFGNSLVKGPISYDIAFNREIAELKHFTCPACGDFDIVMGPDIHSNNLMGKVWLMHCNAAMAGLVAGAKVPIVLSSRGATAEEKYLSIALAAVVAAGTKFA